MTIYIYGLSDPRSPKLIRYIGQTADWMFRQLQHCANRGSACKTSKGQWIASMRKDGFLPCLTVLEECQECDANEREQYWSSRFPREQLTNDVFSVCRRIRFRDKQKADGMMKTAEQALRKERIEQALIKHRWKILPAARELGMSRPTVYDSMERLGIRRPV